MIGLTLKLKNVLRRDKKFYVKRSNERSLYADFLNQKTFKPKTKSYTRRRNLKFKDREPQIKKVKVQSKELKQR